jgi:hypothetical protein
MKKNILVIARRDKVEALRIAAGLTLLDDAVRIAVLGSLEDTPAMREQLEVLEFAEVPMQYYDESAVGDPAFARELIGADAVYVV